MATTSKFQLTNAIAASPEGAAASSTSGTADAAKAPAAAQTYRLVANPTALSPHVGKKLELIGTLEDQAGATGATASEHNTRALKVESGRVVAESCSEQ